MKTAETMRTVPDHGLLSENKRTRNRGAMSVLVSKLNNSQERSKSNQRTGSKLPNKLRSFGTQDRPIAKHFEAVALKSVARDSSNDTLHRPDQATRVSKRTSELEHLYRPNKMVAAALATDIGRYDERPKAKHFGVLSISTKPSTSNQRSRKKALILNSNLTKRFESTSDVRVNTPPS
jgi:hypothetical protein